MKFIQTLLITAAISILSVNALAVSRVMHAEWEYPNIGNVSGYRLYHENTPVCETTDPVATSMNCTVDAPDGESWFTITTFFENGIESPHSSPLSYIFSSDLKAIFTADTLAGEAPLPVTFDATLSTGNIVSYQWTFGDGETGIGNIINHIFTSAGNYTVTLRTTDDAGAVDLETVSVVVTSPSVNNTPPTAVISSSTSVGDAPLQVQFNGTDSSDSDGTILTYRWDMGDGSTQLYGPQVTYTYPSAGSFNATLTVIDDGGLTDTISTPVIVNQPPRENNKPPKAFISASTARGKKPLKVSFSAVESTDSDGTISSYTWNFGDGTTASGPSVSHKFSQAANYTVTLKVTDNMGAASELASYTVIVLDTDPSQQEPLPDHILHSLPAIYELLLKPSSE